MTEHVKYPRTLHLPWSESVTDDDAVGDAYVFEGREVVVTEKLDGENTSLYADGLHARSLDSRHHASRSWVKAFHAGIAVTLTDDVRIVGENLTAVHSIRYSALPSYFFAFAAYRDEMCLSWNGICALLAGSGIEIAPVLWRGVWDESQVRATYTGRSVLGGEQEGYVVRLADAFDAADHGTSVMKYVRANHVQTDAHWMRGEFQKNGLV